MTDFATFLCVWAGSFIMGPEKMADICIDKIVTNDDLPDVLRGMAEHDASAFLLTHLTVFGEQTLPRDVLRYYKERLPAVVHQVVRRARFQDAAAGREAPNA